jgi:hypothetical protein
MTNELKRKLYTLADDALNEQAQIENMETFQSVVSMVHTLIEAGRIKQLQFAIHLHFPEYFIIPAPLLFSDN